MTDSTVLWMAVLGLGFLIAGLVTHRVDARRRPGAERLLAFGPALIASGLAAFAAEHFTAGPILARIVPKFMPAALVVTYLVGVAHLAAASSFVARRFVRASSIWLAIMFGLFVLLMDLPGTVARPGTRILWSLVAREATFAIGALALYATAVHADRPGLARRIASGARRWTAVILAIYGLENLLYPQFTPGVPDVTPTPAWVPAPRLIAYIVGALLVACGLAMARPRRTPDAAACAAGLLIALTIGMFVPDFFVVHSAGARVNSLNFVFDTLLFAGTILTIGSAAAIGRTSGRLGGAAEHNG